MSHFFLLEPHVSQVTVSAYGILQLHNLCNNLHLCFSPPFFPALNTCSEYPHVTLVIPLILTEPLCLYTLCEYPHVTQVIPLILPASSTLSPPYVQLFSLISHRLLIDLPSVPGPAHMSPLSSYPLHRTSQPTDYPHDAEMGGRRPRTLFPHGLRMRL